MPVDSLSMSGLAASGSTAPASEPLAVACRGVTKAFGTQAVLHDLDFAPPPGAVVGLLGTNGAGKSTLLKCMVGLLRVDAGAIIVGSHDAWDLPADIKARLGYVDQQPRFYPWMKAKHLLPYLGSFYPRWDTDLLDRLAAAWDVPMNKAFGKLSPGQQQKVALLAAVGHRPDLLILDEPVSALDPAARRGFLRSLLELVAETNPTVILSTHITSDVERVASHVAILAGGRMRCFEELDALKERMKRLRVSSASPFAEGFTVAGAVRTEVAGANATALVAEDPTGVANALAGRDGMAVMVEDLNLEEVFLELVRGEVADVR